MSSLIVHPGGELQMMMPSGQGRNHKAAMSLGQSGQMASILLQKCVVTFWKLWPVHLLLRALEMLVMRALVLVISSWWCMRF